ncbi:hypothetical protein RDV84_04805 [Lysobacter yananisis]|uniref:DUF420 domain-containing protein n=1 Tax=Lysobacter yananisis TaxID=1003114 RepID=A0ABY9PBB1_9GAMM|nr:hypothetical protein [Lysobacter yananisis]WMT04171.1 hypothetical protein RDV84_04805 [Lysobacter yananisis]
MEDNVYARATDPAVAALDQATHSSLPHFTLMAMFVGSLLATPVAGGWMIALNYRARGNRGWAWLSLATTALLIAPVVAFVDYGAMAISYNHDPSRMPLQMGALLSLQAAAVTAIGYFLKGDELRARHERGLPLRSWWAVCSVSVAAAALLLVYLLAPALLAGLRA